MILPSHPRRPVHDHRYPPHCSRRRASCPPRLLGGLAQAHSRSEKACSRRTPSPADNQAIAQNKRSQMRTQPALRCQAPGMRGVSREHAHGVVSLLPSLNTSPFVLQRRCRGGHRRNSGLGLVQSRTCDAGRLTNSASLVPYSTATPTRWKLPATAARRASAGHLGAGPSRQWRRTYRRKLEARSACQKRRAADTARGVRCSRQSAIRS